LETHGTAGVTVILPVMSGWSVQKYSTTPGRSNVMENSSLVSIALERNDN
jgi:hypothetical protein